MLPDRVSNPGPLTYKSGALPIALRGPAGFEANSEIFFSFFSIKTFCNPTLELFWRESFNDEYTFYGEIQKNCLSVLSVRSHC